MNSILKDAVIKALPICAFNPNEKVVYYFYF